MLHEYLRDTLGLSYSECKSCKNRTQFTCIECGFCYSCHWRNEKLEKIIQFKLANTNSTLFKSYPQPATATTAQTEQSRHQPTQQQQQQQLTKVIDVFGRETEPICSYHACHHKFSLHRHSTRTCKCHHPQNHIVGVSVL
jgi:hypothetical protein